MANRAHYRIRRVDLTIVAIEDQFDPRQPTRTVTNDAEQVIADLDQLLRRRALGGIGNRVVVYRDTEGRWDELIVREGKFVDFAPGGPTLDDALTAAAKRRGGAQP